MPIVGDVLAGRYRIDAPIGVGGMASVYRATDLRLERDVAVKVLLPNLAADPNLSQRFEREARALGATSHPSIVKVFDVEPGDPVTGREPFYVMELCEGGSLADRLASRGRLDPSEAVAVVAAVASGLADLHGRGFVHRDVKPHNILFDGERARLADFGLTRSEDRSDLTALTATGATAGTLAYLAPELLRAGPASPASDVYALGVVAFQTLTGRLPRPANSITELVESHAAGAPTVSSVAAELGTAFDAPVAAALASDPSVRPSALGLADGMAAALLDAGSSSAATATPVVAVAPPPAHAAAPDPAGATQADIPVPATPPASSADVLRSSGRGSTATTLGLLALALLVALALWALLGNGDPELAPGTTPSASTTPIASASPPATASPIPTPTPPPAPTAVTDPAAEAYAVLDQVDAAIEALAGVEKMRERDLEALRRRASDVRSALEAREYAEARNRTEQLADEVDRVDDRVEGEAIEDLKDAVSVLDEAIPSG